jgi:hypothetical protein
MDQSMQHMLLILAGLVVAAGLGYFVGYDHGFEKVTAAPAGSAFEVSTVSSAADVMARIIGNWQSMEDPAFTREIRNDGVVVDRYTGTAGEEGFWMVFTKEIPNESFTGELEDGAVYLALSMGEEEKYYFKVTEASGDSLELIYLDRGGALSFTRIP